MGPIPRGSYGNIPFSGIPAAKHGQVQAASSGSSLRDGLARRPRHRANKPSYWASGLGALAVVLDRFSAIDTGYWEKEV